VVLEIPPADEGSITGTVMDVWQCALEDVGPAGVDKGKGGKYLILPPGYKDKVPAGYIPMPSDTYTGYALLRSILKSGSEADVAQAVAYGKQIKLYPLSQAASPSATAFVDVVDRGVRQHDSVRSPLLRVAPPHRADGALAGAGQGDDRSAQVDWHREGQAFAPDSKTQDVLKDAAREAQAWLVAGYEASLLASPFYEGGHWARPGSRELFEGQATFFAKPDVYPIDVRGVTFSYAYFTPKHPGAGSSYLLAIADKDGAPPRRRRTLSPDGAANAPVEQYWSATVYDRARMRRSGMPGGPAARRRRRAAEERRWVGGRLLRADRAGRQGVELGPTNAAEASRCSSASTVPRRPLFDKTWKLPDIENGEPK
jgi:hypothetical protein